LFSDACDFGFSFFTGVQLCCFASHSNVGEYFFVFLFSYHMLFLALKTF